MATLGDIRAALVTVLKDATQVTVLDRPPRQLAALPSVFLGGRTGSTESQDGGCVVTIPVYVAFTMATNDQLITIDDYIDGERSIIDAFDANPDLGLTGVSANVSTDWSDGVVEVGGQDYFALQLSIEVHY